VAIGKDSQKPADKKHPSGKQNPLLCFNRDCKLKKRKPCAGFEGCPGFKGKQ
jgi:hypothetical protein